MLDQNKDEGESNTITFYFLIFVLLLTVVYGSKQLIFDHEEKSTFCNYFGGLMLSDFYHFLSLDY